MASQETQTIHKKRYHRSMPEKCRTSTKKCDDQPLYNPPRTKDEIIAINRMLYTADIVHQNEYKLQKLFNLFEYESSLLIPLLFFGGELPEDMLKEYQNELKKVERRIRDCVNSYTTFLDANFTVLAFGGIAPATMVPDNKILHTERYYEGRTTSDRHASSKNKKKKFSQYKKSARNNKNAERDFFLRDWIYCDDDTVVTLADVEEAKMNQAHQSPAQQAYEALATAPCVEEAAWAIHDGTEFEHAQELADAYQLLANYLEAISME